MITATITGNVWSVKEIGENRAAVRFRCSVARYDPETKQNRWEPLYATAFVPATMANNLEQGDPITLIADVVPDVYDNQPTLRVGRVHRLIRAWFPRERTGEATVDVPTIDDLTDESYDPFAEE